MRGAWLTLLRWPWSTLQSAASIALNLPDLPQLAGENRKLRESLAQDQLELARLRESLRQTQQSSALITALPEIRGVVAQVIGRSTLPTQQTLLINKGGRDGLTLQTIVLDASGVVGRVAEVYPTTALVALLSDSESRVASVVERSRETGLLRGFGLGQGQLLYLSDQADVQEGDRVLTAGLGGPFPKGLLLGVVSSVIRDETSGEAKVAVNFAASLGRLEDVLCVLQGSSG